MQLQAGLLLQVAEHAEEISGLRVAARPEHADQALRLRAGRLAQFLEADRRLDVVAQDRLAGVDVAASMVSMPSRNSASPNSASLATRRCTNSLKLRVSAILSSVQRVPRLRRR